ncbi:MAG: hypothetical protein IKW83_00445 [Muribaculaceae bacterium]|nr:hypothetical protein [Muribaculaceae bacterium]
MSSSINISFNFSPVMEADKVNKKDYRSSASNNYSADVIDLENEVTTIEIEAINEASASEKAESIAFEMGIQVSYINIYKQF